MRVVSPVEGRFQRWGNWAEFDNWLETTAPSARRLGRSAAIQTVAVGATLTLPVVVHNWSDTGQSGAVQHRAAGRLHRRRALQALRQPRPGRGHDGQLQRLELVHELDAPDHGRERARRRTPTSSIPITTTYNNGGTGSENLTLGVVPKTTVPAATAAPTLDGAEGAGEYSGEALDIGRKWEPGGQRDCVPLGVDCGSSSAPGTDGSTYAKVTRSGEDLYFFIHVKDDFQSYAVKPEECVAHWLADSVEIIIDPRGNASQVLKDTANTFKLGVFPYTNDPTNYNGNGVNGPCWERDADNHQGFSTGPLASTVDDAPNAAGVQVKSTATWVGTNDTTTSHAYAGGGYNLEVKIPLADLPGGGQPGRLRAEHHPLRQRRQHGRHRLDRAAPHRSVDAPGVVDLRLGPVGPVPLGPRVDGGLHAAGELPDDAAHAERLAPEPQRCGLAADDRPVGPQRRADLRP